MQSEALRILSDREWILTNGLGGYALGFGNMINRRKYNGLLISAFDEFKRIHVLATVEEKVEVDGNVFYLDSNHYPNCVYPDGVSHIVKMWFRPYPCTLYSSVPFKENYLIFKEMFMFQGKNAVTLKYTNLGKKPISLVLRPKFTLRDHHVVNQPGTWDRVSLEKQINTDSFRVHRSDTGDDAYCYISSGSIVADEQIYRSIYYPLDALRGYDAIEDLISPVRVMVTLKPLESVRLTVSSAPIEDVAWEIGKAEERYKSYPLPEDHPDKNSNIHLALEKKAKFDRKSYYKILEMAASDFIVGDDVIAGYPWFGTWGRDTLISMGGFKYIQDGSELAIKILKKYGSHLEKGLLPNTFGEGGVGLNYDSVDAPLWFVLRCFEYAPKDKELFNYVVHVILHYMLRESMPFFVADDGLIEIRHGNHALTWMDAKVYDSPVTPRWGKPIEINALWYNALCAFEKMAKMHNEKQFHSRRYDCTIDVIESMIKKVGASLKKFIGPEYLADRIENNEPVWEIRPNAVIALSLPFDFVEKDEMKKVWSVAKEKLLTPLGLRTLDPEHSAFKQKYIGNQKQRDLAYHQGTVWSYLLSPLAKLAWKIFENEKSKEELCKEVGRYIWEYRNGFLNGELASVAEVFDGEDAFFHKGTPAQAWSVFALIEIEELLKAGRSFDE